MNDRVVIAGYLRSPFCPAHRGELRELRPDELGGQVVRALVEQTGVAPDAIEDVTMGCAFPEAEQGMNVGRIVGVLAGLPRSVAGATINRFCGSAMQAIHTAAGSIAMGMGEAYVAGGTESMSRVPMIGFNFLPHPGLVERYPQIYMSMGETAEHVARRYGITRERQEAFAVGSQQRAAAAQADGRLAEEIAPVRVGDVVIDAGRLPAAGHHCGGSGGAQARLPGRRQRHRRHVLPAHRRRHRVPRHHRVVRARARGSSRWP